MKQESTGKPRLSGSPAQVFLPWKAGEPGSHNKGVSTHSGLLQYLSGV